MHDPTAMTMGQGAHHLGVSPAPAARNSMSEQGIGASSLPAPPLVTTRAGPGELSQGSTPITAAAQGCITRLTGAGARHMGHGSARTDEHRRLSQCRDLDMHGAMPGGLAQEVRLPRQCTTRRSGTFDFTPGPGGPAVSEAGRHWAPIARQRATVKARHSGLAWPTYCNKPKGRRPSWTAWGPLSPTAPSMSTGK